MSVVTFLFTDIEGSTRRWEADAGAMRVALEAHNQALRAAIEAHAGHVFNYTGDGMCAVFASHARPSTPPWRRSGHLSCRCGWASGRVRPSSAAANTSAPF
jgi:class 3 adenylate cyclase